MTLHMQLMQRLVRLHRGVEEFIIGRKSALVHALTESAQLAQPMAHLLHERLGLSRRQITRTHNRNLARVGMIANGAWRRFVYD